MKANKQQMVIAEMCGWREAFPKHSPPHPETKRGGILLPYYWVNEINHARALQLPDYLNDQNAIYDAEEHFTYNQLLEYTHNLAVVHLKAANRNDWTYDAFVHIPANERAEALLKTIGKWEEE